MKAKDLEVALVKHGVRRGIVTFQELNDAFPAEYFPLEEMEAFLSYLEDMGVRIVESKECAKSKSRHRRAA